jgi:tetratricopeptide (TPR) repeat protein
VLKSPDKIDGIKQKEKRGRILADIKTIDSKIMEGYKLLSSHKIVNACDIWLEAWEGLKTFMSENSVDDINLAHIEHNWSEFPSNYVQDLEAELHNAGLRNPEYFKKRIIYCTELLAYVGDDTQMKQNTCRAIADSYYEMGETAECDRLYEKWLAEDPKWGWGYLGWFMCYESTYNGRQDITKATEIINRALNEPDVRGRLDIVDKALVFYEENGGGAGLLTSLRDEFSKLTAASPGHQTDHKAIPVTSVKIGRNDPCPCGSGKKYKKCHGASDIV